uniref:VWFA domain-containing protein n=1 Tax=Panagrolaimus davidi TaxID=227884 RepID=A0A914PAW9_9BILA
MVGLSEQELVDCETNSNGCNGGWAHGALYYIYYNGIHSRTNYPYIGWGGTCQANTTGEKIKIEDTIGFWPKNETAVKDFIFNKGPVIFDFIFPYSLQYYVSGIFSLTQNECMSQANGGHSVVIIGYGVENGKKYWIAKNSWGNYWGENGFFRFERDISFCDWNGREQHFAPLFEKRAMTTSTTTTTTTTTTPAPPPTTSTQPPPFTPLNCSSAMDLVFVIDASDTMTSDRFTVIKSQLLNAISQNKIKLENDTARIGIVLSTGQGPGEQAIPFRYFDFKACQSTYYQNCRQRIPATNFLRSAVRSMPYDGGINDIALNMKATLEGDNDVGFGERLFGGSDDRQNVQNAMIVITGADTSNVTQISNQLKASGVQVFSIGFYDTSVSHLEAISGNPSAAFSTYPENVANVIEQICTGINPWD